MRRTLISRATGREGHVQAVVCYDGKLPTFADHRKAEQAIRTLYRQSFGKQPKHVGSATLPYVEDLDEPGE